MPKEAFYFPHDYNASRDEKLLRLRRSHGWASIGLYWAIIERLYENAGRISADFGLLAYEFQADQEMIEAVVKSFGLFEIVDGMVASASVDRRMDERRERSEAAKASAGRRWGVSDATAMRPHSDRNANPMLERKGKEKKEKKRTDYAPSPSDSTPPSAVFLTFDCNGARKQWHLTEAKLAEYQGSFPGVDCKSECRKAWQWCVDHPANRKTERGMPAFLSRWLGRAQDSARPTSGGEVRPVLPGLCARCRIVHSASEGCQR